jgi:hypothetical protein
MSFNPVEICNYDFWLNIMTTDRFSWGERFGAIGLGYRFCQNPPKSLYGVDATR